MAIGKSKVSRARFQPDARALRSPEEAARHLSAMQDSLYTELARVAAKIPTLKGAVTPSALASGYTILGYGTAFPGSASNPGSPNVNDLYFRTDQGYLYYYTGSVWRALQGTAAFSAWLTANVAPGAGVATIIGSSTGTGTKDSNVDLLNGFSTTTGKYTVVVPGLYLINAGARWSSTAAAGISYEVDIVKNGSTVFLATDQSESATAGRVFTPVCSGIVACAAGDTIWAQTLSGTAGQTLVGTVLGTWVNGMRVG